MFKFAFISRFFSLSLSIYLLLFALFSFSVKAQMSSNEHLRGTTAYSNPANLENINNPDLVYRFNEFYPVDFKSFSVGGTMAANFEPDITVTGVSGTVIKAYLYWHVSTSTFENPPSNTGAYSASSINGFPITGTHIATSADACWKSNGYSYTYRADVTNRVTGNGIYQLPDTIDMTPTNLIVGYSLIIIYQDGNSSNDRIIRLWDGNDANFNSSSVNQFDPEGWQTPFFTMLYNGNQAAQVFLELHVAGGQPDPSDGNLIFTATNALGNQTLTMASGAIFQGDSVPGADVVVSGTNYKRLYDVKTFNITNPIMYPGVVFNPLLTHNRGSDCLNLLVAVMDSKYDIVVPTASTATLGGTIRDSNGEPLRNINLSLTKPNGEILYTTSNQLGKYSFPPQEIGHLYIVSVSGKRYVFSPESKLINLLEENQNVDFIGNSAS